MKCKCGGPLPWPGNPPEAEGQARAGRPARAPWCLPPPTVQGSSSPHSPRGRALTSTQHPHGAGHTVSSPPPTPPTHSIHPNTTTAPHPHRIPPPRPRPPTHQARTRPRMHTASPLFASAGQASATIIASLTWTLFTSLLAHRLVLDIIDAHCFICWDVPGDVLAAPESGLCGWTGVILLSLYISPPQGAPAHQHTRARTRPRPQAQAPGTTAHNTPAPPPPPPRTHPRTPPQHAQQAQQGGAARPRRPWRAGAGPGGWLPARAAGPAPPWRAPWPGPASAAGSGKHGEEERGGPGGGEGGGRRRRGRRRRRRAEGMAGA